LPERRFPPPWTVEDLGSCFVVKDSGGQKLAYIYFEEEPGRQPLPTIKGPNSRFAGAKWRATDWSACMKNRHRVSQAVTKAYHRHGQYIRGRWSQAAQEPGRRSSAKLLSKDEARRIATNVAKLPGAETPIAATGT
jgi:hypothetical protein